MKSERSEDGKPDNTVGGVLHTAQILFDQNITADAKYIW
jgi:hypothetical protein